MSFISSAVEQRRPFWFHLKSSGTGGMRKSAAIGNLLLLTRTVICFDLLLIWAADPAKFRYKFWNE